NVTFTSTITGAQALEVASTATTTFGGEIGVGAALTSLKLAAGGTTAINTDMVLTAGDQTFNNAVTLGASTTLSSSAGKIPFASTIDAGTKNLTSQGDEIDFNDKVSGSGDLTLQPFTASRDVRVGDTATVGTALNLTAADL